MYRPIRPSAGLLSGAGPDGTVGGDSMLRLLQLHVHRPAGGFQRPQVELDVDGDSLADQVLGYSP